MIEVGHIQAFLEDAVGAPVDLVIIDLGVPPYLAKTIIDETILVYDCREEAYEDLARLYIAYLDYEVFYRKHSKRS